jgi:hypothetical protein
MYRAGGRRLTVNALHKCSHVPVELLRGLHKGNVFTMIVIDARDVRDTASNIVKGQVDHDRWAAAMEEHELIVEALERRDGGGQDNTIVFPLDNQR